MVNFLKENVLMLWQEIAGHSWYEMVKCGEWIIDKTLSKP